MLKITTNGQPRDLICYHDLTEREQADFDYLDSDEWYDARFFRYRDYVYDAHEFTVIAPTTLLHYPELAAWQGMQSDSFFSGVLLKHDNDFESVIVGTYYS